MCVCVCVGGEALVACTKHVLQNLELINIHMDSVSFTSLVSRPAWEQGIPSCTELQSLSLFI